MYILLKRAIHHETYHLDKGSVIEVRDDGPVTKKKAERLLNMRLAVACLPNGEPLIVEAKPS